MWLLNLNFILRQDFRLHKLADHPAMEVQRWSGVVRPPNLPARPRLRSHSFPDKDVSEML